MEECWLAFPATSSKLLHRFMFCDGHQEHVDDAYECSSEHSERDGQSHRTNSHPDGIISQLNLMQPLHQKLSEDDDCTAQTDVESLSTGMDHDDEENITLVLEKVHDDGLHQRQQVAGDLHDMELRMTLVQLSERLLFSPPMLPPPYFSDLKQDDEDDRNKDGTSKRTSGDEQGDLHRRKVQQDANELLGIEPRLMLLQLSEELLFSPPMLPPPYFPNLEQGHRADDGKRQGRMTTTKQNLRRCRATRPRTEKRIVRAAAA